MAAHVLQIGKHKFVCGLFWQSLSRPRDLHKEAVELGRRVKFDLMVLRKDYGTVQAGYANTSEGVRPGMLSLGAAIAKTVSIEGAHYDGRKQPVPNWLAALKLPDGQWAYFAVRDENFLPTGDFTGSKEEVVERLQANYALGGWNVVFADEELRGIGFHNFHARNLDEFLPHGRGGDIRVHGWWALQSLTARRERALLAVAVVAFMATIAGLYAFYDQHRRQEGQRALASAVQAARQATGRGPATPPPHPWPAQVLPADFVRECMSRLQHLSAGGWTLDGYECTATSASHAWKRGGSVVAYLLEWVPDAVVALDGNSARFATPLGAKPSGRDEALLASRAVLAAVTSDLQALGLKPQLTAVPAPAAPKPATRDAAPPPGPPDWQTYRLSLKTNGISPAHLVGTLEQPGVRLTKAAFNGEDWSIEGVIYAK